MHDLLAVVKSQHFLKYLYGEPFFVEVDLNVFQESGRANFKMASAVVTGISLQSRTPSR